ncbi:MAG TPA: hypothetical protein DCZ69_07040 [Syntrophobacteraceae bacterium]|nr:hypothetical protein [Syntrophobacteraceae bacterium]
MKLHEITIKPASGFGTPLKGDTLFGHFCWQAAYDPTLLNGGLDRWIAQYANKPFAVFSSAWPKFCLKNTQYALKRPDLPLSLLFKDTAKSDDRRKQLTERKANSKKKWVLISEDLRLTLNSMKYFTDDDLAEMAPEQATAETHRHMIKSASPSFITEFAQPHNTINRLTFSTGESWFAPFSETASFYYPETELAVFVLLDEDATDVERVCTAMERIGQWGFGKNASTGLGRFDLGESEPLSLPVVSDANACYTLSPVVPESGLYATHYFTPFIRFGKHGDVLAKSRNPFKNPVIMANEGAVFVPRDANFPSNAYIGRAVFHTSKALPQSVVQGYSIYLPFRLEM